MRFHRQWHSVRKVLGLLIFLGISPSIWGQAESNTTLEVYDQDTGNSLPFATVFSLPDTSFSGFTDENGRIDLPFNWSGEDRILVTYLNYDPAELFLNDLAGKSNFRLGMVLSDSSILPEEVEVVGRRGLQVDAMASQVDIIRPEVIRSSQAPNSADLLAEAGGLYVQKSQQGGGSPILRGFESNRVLLIVDGLRLNNAIFRGGHLQNAITVDASALASVEVFSGPGSLEYGSDAIGGVVHFRTRQPRFAEQFNILGASTSVQYGTAARHRKISGSLEIGGQAWTSLTLVSANRFGDLLAGRHRPAAFPDFGKRTEYVLPGSAGQDSLILNPEPDRQIFSGYDQLDLLHKQRLDMGGGWEAQLNLQYSTSSNIPRYDQLTQRRNGSLRWAEWYYGPQTRLLTALRLEHRSGTDWYDYFSLLLGRQSVAEDRIQRRFNDPLREISEVDVRQWTLQADFDKSIGQNGRLGYGFDGRTDRVISLALLDDLNDELAPQAGGATRYPSQGSTLSSLGAYADYRHARNGWRWGVGLRFNRQWLSARFGSDDPVQWPQAYLEGIGNRQNALTGTASVQRQLSRGRVRLLFAQAFRSPNVDDFAKFRENDGRIQVPNPALKPERANTFELGWNWRTSAGRNADRGLRLEATVYYTFLQNAIIRTDSRLPDGSDFFVSRGDTLRVQANVNAERARVFGFDLGVAYPIHPNWHFRAEGHWLRGRRRQLAPDGQFLWLPQDHIPPAYGRAEVNYQNGSWSARLIGRFQAEKPVGDYAVNEITSDNDSYQFDRTGTSDNLEETPIAAATGEFTGAYAWWTLGLQIERQMGEQWTLRLGLDNIFDRHYRTFGSGISAAGRDLRVSVGWQM